MQALQVQDQWKKYVIILISVWYFFFTGYQSSDNPYFGATVGRVANRMSPTEFEFNGQKLSLRKNAGDIQLHGGVKGFDKVTNCLV